MFFYYLISKAKPAEYKRTRGDSLWMIVSDDKYELPLYVADTGMEIADVCGYQNKSTAHSLMHKNMKPRKRYYGEKVKYIRVLDVNKNMEDENED